MRIPRIGAVLLLAAVATGADAAPPSFTGVSLYVQSPVQQYETCISIAEPIGGSGPWEYEWFINNVYVGEGQWPGNLFWTNDGSSYSVRVEITETSTHITHSATDYVSVYGSGGPACYQ